MNDYAREYGISYTHAYRLWREGQRETVKKTLPYQPYLDFQGNVTFYNNSGQGKDAPISWQAVRMKNTGSLFLSLNALEGDVPVRIELVPVGATVTERDGRTWKNTNPQQAALNSMKRLAKLSIDVNHATDLAAPKGGASPAFGWITALTADGRGAIFADVEWTPRGTEAVKNKEYGFISPVFFSTRKGRQTAFCGRH